MEALAVSERLGLARYVSEQPPYNLLDRRIENELIPFAQRYGLAILPWAPLAQGVLAGRYPAEGPLPADSRAIRQPGQANIYADRVTPRGLEVGRAFTALARAHGRTPGQLALLWCKDQPGVTVADCGATDGGAAGGAAAGARPVAVGRRARRLRRAGAAGRRRDQLPQHRPLDEDAHPMKLAFIGTHGTGKTTLCYDVTAGLKRQGLNADMVKEVARLSPLPINRKTSLDAQTWILMTQVAEEIRSGSAHDVVVCDRSVLDNYAYMVLSCGRQKPIERFVDHWMKSYDVLIKVPMMAPADRRRRARHRRVLRAVHRPARRHAPRGEEDPALPPRRRQPGRLGGPGDGGRDRSPGHRRPAHLASTPRVDIADRGSPGQPTPALGWGPVVRTARLAAPWRPARGDRGCS